jgi:serine/threonine protein kinase
VDPKQWERVARIFKVARALESAERARYVQEQCADDTELRAEVDALLAHDEASQPFLDEPALGSDFDVAEAVTQSLPPETVRAGRRIGRYEVIRPLASGGMGTVYEAVQDRPHRLVALKVLRRGAASPQALTRFNHEAEILGRLRHPNIAQVYDAGTFDDGDGAQPYFAMELIKGQPLIEYVVKSMPEPRKRLELFARICDAVQYAHHKGIIHRDIKPDNVLVDDLGEPKILDFGVARVTDSDIRATTMRTDIGQLIGTIPYMSPEQVSGDPAELDTRSDVYSLGVVLYELMGGCLPHDLKDKSIPDAVRVIREEDPRPLSSIDHVFRGDIETIACKALEKEKDRRYQSPADLAAAARNGRYDRGPDPCQHQAARGGRRGPKGDFDQRVPDLDVVAGQPDRGGPHIT